jgi:hypothetical protein
MLENAAIVFAIFMVSGAVIFVGCYLTRISLAYRHNMQAAQDAARRRDRV